MKRMSEHVVFTCQHLTAEYSGNKIVLSNLRSWNMEYSYTSHYRYCQASHCRYWDA